MYYDVVNFILTTNFRLTEGYLDCLYYEVRDKCGHHVAITFRSLMVQLFRPTFSPYGCGKDC